MKMPDLTRTQVSYDDDKPEGSLNEINGQSADINKGFGGT